MTATAQSDRQRLPTPLMIADHPALDFLNTIALVQAERVDFFQSDADVLAWLRKASFPSAAVSPVEAGELVETARSVRELLRAAIALRKQGKSVNVAPLNEVLSKCSSRLILRQSKSHGLQRTRTWDGSTPEQLLGPVIESAVDLLVTGEFDLIRPCEGVSCILWFYDRTKSHHRRWCSMTSCGNRSKVAAFRERQRAAD